MADWAFFIIYAQSKLHFKAASVFLFKKSILLKLTQWDEEALISSSTYIECNHTGATWFAEKLLLAVVGRECGDSPGLLGEVSWEKAKERLSWGTVKSVTDSSTEAQ